MGWGWKDLEQSDLVLPQLVCACFLTWIWEHLSTLSDCSEDYRYYDEVPDTVPSTWDIHGRCCCRRSSLKGSQSACWDNVSITAVQDVAEAHDTLNLADQCSLGAKSSLQPVFVN